MAVNYFEFFFSSSFSTHIAEVLEEVPSMILAQMNKGLAAYATKEEVRKALFMMHPEKTLSQTE